MLTAEIHSYYSISHQGPIIRLHTCRDAEGVLYDSLPLYESPVGQADAVLPQDVGHGQRDAHVSGNVSQPLVKLLKLLGRWRTKHTRTRS